MASIELINLHKRYGEQSVLNGINLKIQDGEFVSLVGESGSGKSTLLRTIAGLETHSSGEILIDGESAGHLLPRERKLAMVFQSYALYPHLSVFDNIAMPLRMQCKRLHRTPIISSLLPSSRRVKANIEERVKIIAESLHILPILHRRPGQLSGGQRQRVALGRAMVRNPKAFLMDEPLSNLDATLRVHMRRELVQMHREMGSTFVYVTHDQAEAMTMSDRVAVLIDGELAQIDTSDTLYRVPSDLRVAKFIGTPKINVFDATVQKGGVIAFNKVKLDRELVTRIDHTQGAKISLAIRPEDASIDASGEGHLKGKVQHIENLGSEALVHLQCGQSQELIVRCSPCLAHSLSSEACYSVRFNEQQLHIFDNNGKRLAQQQNQVNEGRAYEFS